MILDDLDQKYLEWAAQDIILFGENGNVMSQNEYERFEYFFLNYPNLLANESLYRIVLFGKSYEMFMKSTGLGEKLNKVLDTSSDEIATALVACNTIEDLLSNKTVLDDVMGLNYSWTDATFYSVNFVVNDYIMKNITYMKNLMDNETVMNRIFITNAVDMAADATTCAAIKADSTLNTFVSTNYPDFYATI